jgi:hypothetical protein
MSNTVPRSQYAIRLSATPLARNANSKLLKRERRAQLL